MDTDLFRMVRNGWFKAYRVDEIGTNSYDTEITTFHFNQYNDGTFELKIYSCGDLKDIEMNGWKFGHLVKGKYHLPGSYKSVGYYIEAIDPQGKELNFWDKSYFFYKPYDAACKYFNKILFLSFFENADLVNRFNDMINYRRMLFDPYSNKAENVLVALINAKLLKEYYENGIYRNKESLFLEKLKEEVNNTLDIIIRAIDQYRIS